MNILVATSNRAIVGGIETYVQELLPSLRGRGHRVGLLFEHPATGAATIDGDGTHGPVWRANGVPRAQLLGDIAAWRPHVIYCQGHTDPGLDEALLNAFPCVLFAHDYYSTCISGQKCHEFPLAQPCDRVLGPSCLGLYLPRRCGGLNPLTMFRRYASQRRSQSLIKRYGAVLVASRHMHDEYAKHGVDADRLHRVPLFAPGMEPDAKPPTERPRTERVLLAGRLTKLKGGSLLVQAMAQASKTLGRPLALIVAGDGPEREAIARVAHQVGLAVEFHGWVDRTKCASLMRGADLLAVPSVWPEPFGLVGLEAACVGLPAVAFDVGGIRDWLHPGESGEMAPGNPPTAEGLSEALVRALADPIHRDRLARGAWLTAQEFTLQRHFELLEIHLERVAGAAPVEGRTC